MRLTYRYEETLFQDDAGSHKFLLDISEKLSQLYGRMIRQGQIFRVRKIEARIFNPGTLVQDVVMSASGNYVFMTPTANRKKAWKMAFDAVQANRRLLGNNLVKNGNYDFRIGLAPGYSTDVGLFGEGVAFNAWIKSDADSLLLAGHSDNGIMDVYNHQLKTEMSPHNPEEGFGTWIGKNVGATTDQLDFVNNEQSYFIEGTASTSFDYAPFSCAFSSVYDSAGDAQDSLGTVTTPSVAEGPMDVMCGLIGIHVDTTGIDDSLTQTQEYGLEIIVDVESWKPILQRKKRGRRKSKK